MKKLICLSIVFVTFFSCSSDETTETFIDENIDIITTPTQAKAKVFNFNEEPQPGYTVLMFEEQPDIESPLPQILMQGVSDNEGEVVFDLEELFDIFGEKTYYFVAFTEVSNGFIWKSSNVGSLDITENTISTTFLYVN